MNSRLPVDHQNIDNQEESRAYQDETNHCWYEPIFGYDEDQVYRQIDREEITDASYIRFLELSKDFQEKSKIILSTLSDLQRMETKAIGDIREQLDIMKRKINTL